MAADGCCVMYNQQQLSCAGETAWSGSGLVEWNILDRFPFLLQGRMHKQNNMTSELAPGGTRIDQHFVEQLFTHPAFRAHLHRSINQLEHRAPAAHLPLANLVEEVTADIAGAVTSIAERSILAFRKQIAAVRAQVQRIKEVHLSQSTKADFFERGSEDMNFEDEQLFDLPSIKRTINSLQERMREMSLNSSAFLDTSELLRESRIKEDSIQDRISRLQQTHLSLEDAVNKKIEKQQKTINNILETLNELHPPKQDKLLLTPSKSAVKLKTFFGFS